MTVEMIVDFRKNPATSELFYFLGTTIAQEHKWEPNISSPTKTAQPRLYFLWQLKKFHLPVRLW